MATHSSVLVWRIPVDRGAWKATVHGVAKSWTRLSHAQGKEQQVIGDEWLREIRLAP